jgi:phytoene dehydrogenase-like protein
VRNFDVALVGIELGGLAAAALLSKRGKKVIASTPGASLAEVLGSVKKEGFSFSHGPALSHGYEQDGTFRQLLDKLDINEIAPAQVASYQVALPDRRITVSSNHEETLEEIRREFPRDFLSAERFYRDLKKEAERISKGRIAAYLSRFKSAGSFLRHYSFSRELLSFYDLQALYFFQRPVRDLSFSELLVLCRNQPFNFDEGHEMLGDQLAAVVLRAGGEIRYQEPSAKIVFQQNRASSIQYDRESVEAGSILLDTPDQRDAVLFLGIREEVVPAGMGCHVLYLPDYSKPHDFLAISLSPQDEIGSAPRGMRSLTATFRQTTNLLPVKGTLTERTADIIPFLNDFVVQSIEYRPVAGTSIPHVLTDLKPLKAGTSEPLLFKTSNRNVFLMKESIQAPLQTIRAARRFVTRLR